MSVHTRNEHWPSVYFTLGLIVRNNRCTILPGSCVAKPLTEASVTELICTSEELDAILGAERHNAEFHRAMMLVTQWQEISPHSVLHLASGLRIFFGACFARTTGKSHRRIEVLRFIVVYGAGRALEKGLDC